MTGSTVKRALLIGIDAYPYVRPLDGCVNDVALMATVLQEPFGFSPEHIMRLTNEQATRDAILAGLDALVERTGEDDIVVIQYAGHGSQMKDREDDESSGWDNTIMPYDSHRGEVPGNDYRDITDDEIHLRLQALARKTSFITLIFDSCHSGTITRDAFGVQSRGIERDTRSVDQLPPSPIPPEARSAREESGPSGWLRLSRSYVLIAGCHDNETSYEYQADENGGHTPHGALTYFLCAELRQATPGTTYRDVFERAAAKVTATYSTQHPQLEGRIDREVFGVRDITPVRYVRVLERSKQSVTLAAGAALGMTRGSRWSLYPQGTKQASDSHALGEVEITDVSAVTSAARIVAESAPDAIGAGARAVETVHAYGDFRLLVQLVDSGDPAVAAMREELGKSPLLRVVDTSTPASARIYLLQPRPSAGSGAPAPQVGAIGEARWVAIGETGQLLGPPKQRGAEKAVRRNLEAVARYRQALALENPDPANALRDKVKFELLRQGGDGQWQVAVPNTTGGQVMFNEGEHVAFRVTNDHADPVYISILDFSLSGDIGVLYPPPGAYEKVMPGITFEIGSDPARMKIRLAAEENGITDVETFKLVATSDVADFSFLQQEGVRTVSPRQTPFSLLWETATGARAERAVTFEQPVVADSWATVVRPFILRPRNPGSTESMHGEAV